MFAPIARILLRYGAGAVFGMEAGEMLAGDPDIVVLVAAGVSAATEGLYAYAKKQGWST